MSAVFDIIENLLSLFDDMADESKEDTKESIDTICGDIIYPSSTLANRILQYKDDEEKLDEKSEGTKQPLLKSMEHDVPCKLCFINESNKKIYLYWIQYNGEIRSPPAIIKSNNKHKCNSYITHPFILSLSENSKDFKDIIAVYIPQNITYSQHNITINKSATKIKSEPGKIDEAKERKIWTIHSYEKSIINGFIIYFEIGLIDKYPALMHVLNTDLNKINGVVPSAALKILQSTPIWLNDSYLYYDYPKQTKEGKKYLIDIYKPPESMCFHPDPNWLKDHGNITNKAEGIEIYRAKDWIKERGYMPMVLLHEMGHAYHWYLDFNRSDVLNAYNFIKNSKDKLYREIPFILGGKRDAYALTNQMEYFSELTESYFGLNDFYPFNKQELRQYDKMGFKVMETVWFFDDKTIFIEHQKALKNRRADNDEKREEKNNDNKRDKIGSLEIDTSRIVSV